MHSSHCKSISPKVLGGVLRIKAFAHKNLDFKGRLKERRCFDPQFTDRERLRDLKSLLRSLWEVTEKPGTGL